jgi:hypothetical protein
MADYDVDPNHGILDKRKNSRTQSSSNLGTPSNYGSIGALKTRLTAINGAYWTTARLNLYTKADLQYALRLADDSAGV